MCVHLRERESTGLSQHFHIEPISHEQLKQNRVLIDLFYQSQGLHMPLESSLSSSTPVVGRVLLSVFYVFTFLFCTLSHSFIFITFPSESKGNNHSLSSFGHLISPSLLFHTNTFAIVISQDDSFYFPSLFCRSVISLLPDSSGVFHFQVS